MKKNFLFGLLAVLLAGFGFGGVSLADNNVAQIGETQYPTLTGAFYAAVSGDTIQLVDDFTQTKSISITDKTLTLDLNGHVITTSQSSLFQVNGGNLTVDSTSATEGGVNSTAGSIFNVTAGNVTINAGTFTGKSTLIVAGENATAEVNDGTFVGYQNGNSTSVQAKHGAIVTINSGTFIAGQNPGDDKPQKVIYAGDDGNNCGKADQNYEIKGGTINVNGGYFEGRLSKSNSGTYNIIGGTFKVSQNKTAGVGCDYTVCDTLGSSEPNPPVYKGDPSSCKNFSGMAAMLNPGYIAEKVTDGVYTVKEGTTVAVTFSTNGKTRNNVVYIKNGDTISEPAATKYSSGEAGEFDWYDENGVFDFTTPITSDITLYGKWKHTVSFDKNGGTGTIENQEVRDGDKVNKPANPVKSGHVFVGWFNGDDEFDFNVAITNTNDLEITLTGQWKALSDSTGVVEDEDFTGVVLVPAESVLTASQETDIKTEIASSSNSTVTMEGVVELTVYIDNDEDGDVEPGDGDVVLTGKVNFTNARLVRIPVDTTGTVVVKVRHTGQSRFSYDGLSANSAATCTGGKATPAYNGEPITPTSGYVEIWTCSASTFVAYSETKNSTPSSGGSGGSGKASGGSSSSSSTDTSNNTGAKADTGTVSDTEKGDADTSDSTATEDLHKVLEDGYTVEFHNAYDFAFKNGITTMPTIEAANMNSPLTRIAMAKMLSQYAINVLGKKPANVVVPEFPDVTAEMDAQYDNGVTLAYQLGIMGINVQNFRPNDLVTRAEFGTALSRLLFGTPDGEGAYYETHLKKLMEEGIITNDNPHMQEVRGYVMIMLMRSASK